MPPPTFRLPVPVLSIPHFREDPHCCTMKVLILYPMMYLMYGYQQRRRLIDNQDIPFVSEHEMLKGGEG